MTNRNSHGTETLSKNVKNIGIHDNVLFTENAVYEDSRQLK